EERPAFFEKLMPQLQQLRAGTGRPHWIVIDEAHHLTPAEWDKASQTMPQEPYGLILITVHPDQVSPIVLSAIETVITVGESPEKTIQSLCRIVGQEPPEIAPVKLSPGEGVLWRRASGQEAVVFRAVPPRTDRLRHQRK